MSVELFDHSRQREIPAGVIEDFMDRAELMALENHAPEVDDTAAMRAIGRMVALAEAIRARRENE